MEKLEPKIYLAALEYINVAEAASKNGFVNDKINKAIACKKVVEERTTTLKNYPHDNFFKASEDIYNLVCLCRDYNERVKRYLKTLDLDPQYPCKILYHKYCENKQFFVEIELLYEDDSREEMKFFGTENCHTLEDFKKELYNRYEKRGIRVLYVSDLYIRKTQVYYYDYMHSFNIDEIYKENKGGNKNEKEKRKKRSIYERLFRRFKLRRN